MSPIEAYLIDRLTRELARAGVGAPRVEVLSAEAENWRYRVHASDRAFEIGFNHADRLWCRELTAGREQALVSNDHPRITTSDEARQRAGLLIATALARPDFAPRDPPVI